MRRSGAGGAGIRGVCGEEGARSKGSESKIGMRLFLSFCFFFPLQHCPLFSCTPSRALSPDSKSSPPSPGGCKMNCSRRRRGNRAEFGGLRARDGREKGSIGAAFFSTVYLETKIEKRPRRKEGGMRERAPPPRPPCSLFFALSTALRRAAGHNHAVRRAVAEKHALKALISRDARGRYVFGFLIVRRRRRRAFVGFLLLSSPPQRCWRAPSHVFFPPFVPFALFS